MAPLLEEVDVSVSSHDDAYGSEKAVAAPLHEHFPDTSTPKRVSFGPFVVIQEIMSHKDFTEEERMISWYNTDEVSCMRGIARREAKLVEMGHLTESKEVSVRGLETRSKKGSKQKKELRTNSFTAVFLELDFQKAEQIVDDEALSASYFKYSMTASLAAQRLGRQDEIEARRCWRSPTHSPQKERMRGEEEKNKRKGSRRDKRITPSHSAHSPRSIKELHI